MIMIVFRPMVRRNLQYSFFYETTTPYSHMRLSIFSYSIKLNQGRIHGSRRCAWRYRFLDQFLAPCPKPFPKLYETYSLPHAPSPIPRSIRPNHTWIWWWMEWQWNVEHEWWTKWVFKWFQTCSAIFHLSVKTDRPTNLPTDPLMEGLWRAKE